MNRGSASASTAPHPARSAGGPPDSAVRGAARSRGRRRTAEGRDGATAREATVGTAGLAVAVLTLLHLLTVARRGVEASSGSGARPDDVLLLLIACLGVVLAAWLALGCLLAVASLLPGTAGQVAGEVAERVTPAAVRKVLALVLGASVGSMALPAAPVSSAGSGPTARGGAALAFPAGQAPAPDLVPGYAPTELTPGYTPTPGSAGSRRPAGPAEMVGASGSAPATTLPDLPDVDLGPGYSPTPRDGAPRTATPAPPPLVGPGYLPTQPVLVLDTERSRLLVPAPRPVTSAHDLVTVRRGDSLWTIAARHLGAGASDAQVSREWPRWYAANRDVVGEDPDLLLPGVQLRPPTSTPSAAVRASRGAADPSTTPVGAGTAAPAEQGAR